MRTTTLLFLVKKSDGYVSDICLAMKKRGFGMGRWNGTGGKLQGDETPEEAVVRETMEEIGVAVGEIYRVAELSFYFSLKAEWDQIVQVFFCEEWEGEPAESEEMKPKWFAVKDIPFKDMWPDDIFWLTMALKGELVKGSFTFGEKDVILNQEIKAVSEL